MQPASEGRQSGTKRGKIQKKKGFLFSSLGRRARLDRFLGVSLLGSLEVLQDLLPVDDPRRGVFPVAENGGDVLGAEVLVVQVVAVRFF